MDNIENTGIENDETTETITEEQDVQAEGSQDAGEELLEASAESDVEANEKTEKVAKEKAAAAHLAFVAAAKAHAEALGLSTKDQKGFFQVLNASTGMKLYIARQAKSVTRIDTTLPVDVLGDMAHPLSKPNGRITCHVDPASVNQALDLLATFEGKIPSPKKGAAKKAAQVVETETQTAE